MLLYWDTDNNGVIEGPEWSAIAIVLATDVNGNYLFDNLPPGNYLVDVYEDSITSDGVRDIVPTTPNLRDVDLTAGQDVLTADFGYVEGALVEGNIFWDEDHNGVLDPAEANATHLLENVTVTIVCLGADGVPGGTDDKTLSMDTGTGGQPDGHFKFLVPPGPCTLTYDQPDIPAVYGDRTTPVSYIFTAHAGEDWHPTFDFGVDNSGKIGDRVWNDANGDGIQDAGEPGISGVTVRLYAADGTTLLNTLATDTSGNYQFVGLADATYVVKVDTATLPSGYTQTGYGDPGAPCVFSSCNSQGTTTVSGGNTKTEVDFGYKPPANTYPVSGTVWNDNGVGAGGIAGNGTKDGTEPGIPNVNVCLYNAAGGVVACTTTVANGGYTFPGIAGGNYTIKVDPATLPTPAYAQTGDPDSSCPGAGCNNQTPVTVSGAAPPAKDFGYLEKLGSISGTVCVGTNGDGLCQVSELGLSSVTVKLTWAGPDGILGTGDDQTFTDITDAGTGDYSFPNLQPGLYQIEEINPSGYTSLADRDGGNPDNISRMSSSAIPLGAGENAVDRDFEDQLAQGAVSGVVFNDLNGDGVQGPGENGIPGVTVTLKDSSGNPVGTTTTGANGSYSFPNVPPGPYTVVETDPSGYTSTTPNTVPVSVPPGGSTTANFGDQPVGTVSGVVFNDLNGDGVQGPGENGIPGVTVTLKDSSGNPVGTATTGPNGDYSFPNVPAGPYTVVETDPSGYTSTTPNTVPVSVPAGGSATANFGDQPIGTVRGVVFNDLNGDGVQNPGENGIPGVTVQLKDSGGGVVGTTTTAGNGSYLFTNVPAGPYTVVETDPSGYTSTTSNTVPVSVPAGGSAVADFGDQQPGTVSGVVFNDLNGDGVQGPGENGIPGVTVTLKDSSGNPVGTTTTGANGSYSFPNVPPGPYTVVETDPSGYTSTTPNTVPVSVPPGGSAIANFGDQPIGTVSGVVFNDLNGDGVQGPGENGIGGVTVQLKNSGGAVVGTTTTAGNGSYLFTNVAAGPYTVVETDPSGYVSTTSNTVPVSVPPGGSAIANFGDQQIGTVSGVVFNDLNGDGVQDPGENGIGGVTVQLKDSGGAVVGTTTTAGNGSYLFTNVAAGPYTVVETDPSGYVSTTPNTVPVTVPPGGSATADFGDRQPGTVSGVVFNDLNGNGVQDPGENGIGGVTVQLKNSGGGVVGTTTTAGNGSYLFTNVAAGPYTVVETDPSGYTSTTSNTVPVSVPVGGSATADFGDRQPGTVSGVVFNDLNGNGVQDPGENGIGGVTVQLKDSGGAVVGTTTTAGNGGYLFTNVPAGPYTVVETDPSGYVSTTPNTMPVTVPAGGSATADFGDRQPGTVSGVVFNDLDGNGVQDPGENGIGGVTVTLKDSGGNPVGTTTTVGNGGYLFTNVAAGPYTVVETDPSGYVSTTPNTVSVTVPAGGSAVADFGDRLPPLTASYTVTKTLLTGSPTGIGQRVQFRIRIENMVGSAPITLLPLRDTFNRTFLTYGFGPDFATPASDNNFDSGIIEWSDLTAAAPYGFGQDLQPGSFFDVFVNFSAREDTTALLGGVTDNTALVHDAFVGSQPLPQLEAKASVQILRATGVTLAGFTAAAEGQGARLSWQTASEAEILGFNVLRMAEGGAFNAVNGDVIFAEYPGMDQGASYDYLDAVLPPGAYTYRLDAIKLDGSTESYGMVEVIIQP